METTIVVPVPGFTCANCGHRGSGVAYHPHHVARGLRKPLCGDEALCAARWDLANLGGLSPAVADQLAKRSGPRDGAPRAA